MIDIARHIEFLLLHHDCVVVPGFGAFMINDEGARYDAERHCFLPPSRTVGFNPEVRHNDALLTGSISRREGISLEAARSVLDTSVASLNHQLQLCGEVQFGNLGSFSAGVSHDAPVFAPSEWSLPVRRYECLAPIEVMPLVDETEDECFDSEEAATRRQAVFPAPLKFVASIIAIMVGLGILYSTTSLVQSPRLNFASLDTGIGSRIENRAVDTSELAGSLSREILLNIAMPEDEECSLPTETPAKADAVNTCVNTKPAESAIPGRYIIVVGSFPSKRAAERHIAHVDDNSLRIIEMEGNYRVYASSASNISDARRLAESITATYPTAWVCRR